MQAEFTTWKYCSRCSRHKPPTDFHKGAAYCKPCRREYSRERRNYGRERAAHLKEKYGITLEQYEKMVWDQDGCCALCGREGRTVNKRKLCVDHDHTTGKVRALLCRDCNIGLGHFEDDPERLRKAAKYLEEFTG